MATKTTKRKKDSNPKDFKEILWETANNLRNQMDAAEYKHLVIGLIFVKYISDNFTKQQEKILQQVSDPESDIYLGDDSSVHENALERRDYYTQENVFWVPPQARWKFFQDNAKQSNIGELIDKGLGAIQEETFSYLLQN